MATRWQQPQLIFLSKLTETNRAIERLLGGTDHFFVVKNRQSVDEGLVETRVVEMEQLLKLSLKSVAGRDLWVSVRPRSRSGSRSRRRMLDEKPNEQMKKAGDEEQDG